MAVSSVAALIVIAGLVAWGVLASRPTPPASQPAEEDAATTPATMEPVEAPPSPADRATPPSPPPADRPVDLQTMVDRWMRTDYPYVIDIESVHADGTLAAAYYNPQPIHVARADIREQKGTVTVFVELRDVNYPGSTYTLEYDRDRDALQGVYYQALEGQSFDVEFARMPSEQ